MAVRALAWYFLMRMGWGTGSRPTRVPCWRNLRISDSSVKPLENNKHAEPFCSKTKFILSRDAPLSIVSGNGVDLMAVVP